MGKIKKKGAIIFSPTLVSIDSSTRDIRAGEEFYHQNASCAQAPDIASRLQTTVHIQGYGLSATKTEAELMQSSRYLPKGTKKQEESLQVLDTFNHLLLHQGHPVPPS